jgi:hypothetical protein
MKAEEVLAKAMPSMAEANRYQFLLTNLIEGLKRGEAPSRIVERYDDI